MDPPQQKRSIFGGFSFFSSRSATVPASSDTKPDSPKSISPPSLISRAINAPHPFESPAKRASDEQMQSRKISRPQAPSGRVIQARSSFSGSMPPTNGTGRRMPGDNPHKTYGTTPARRPGDNPHKSVDDTPKRMPGDNPHKVADATSKTRGAGESLNKTSNIFNSSINRPPTNFSGATTTPRNNIFRGSTSQRPGIPFSPRVSASATRPFLTPGKPRQPSLEGMSPSKSHLGDQKEFFSLKIDNPPSELTGKRIAEEMSSQEGRTGSVYADEYLAHYCPPHFGDLERRQFFCILDLRRLKYTVDQIFLSRDWKINILQLAKEYEKSRSIIMLRYGLYEFKTVRVSDSVRKEWMAKHGIATSDDEVVSAKSPLPNGGSKRKAEDELTSAESTSVLTASTTNANKRARADDRGYSTETNVMDSSKNKRKAGLTETDENTPSKHRKAAPLHSPTKNPPSATKALFEKIANNASNSAINTPTKTNLFPSTPGKMPNGLSGKSVLESAKPAVMNNIFGHLSEDSKGSGNDDADAESGDDTSSEAEGDSEVQEVTKGVEPAGQSKNSPFPLKSASTNGTSSASSESGQKEKDGKRPLSIFERLTYGNDGKPMRQPEIPQPTKDDTKPSTPASIEDKTTTDTKDKTGVPTNNTWDTNTPIKFAPAAPTNTQAPSFFPPSTSKPTAGAPLFGSAPAKKPEESALLSVADASKTAPVNMYAAASKTPLPSSSTGSASLGTTTPAPAANLFGGTATSVFGQAKESVATSTPAPAANLFGGSATPVFGQAKESVAPSTPAAPAPAPATALFQTQNSGTDAAGSAVFKPTGPATPASTANLFGGLKTPTLGQTEKKEASTPAPAAAMFGGASGPSAPTGDTAKPSYGSTNSATIAPTTTFGSQPPAGTSAGTSVFQSSTLFGSVGKNDAATASLIPSTTALGAANPIAGKTDAGAPNPANNIFGAANSGSSQSNSLFGAVKLTEGASTSGFKFGETPAKPATTFFGAGASTAPAPSVQSAEKKPIFGGPIGGSAPSTFGLSQSTRADSSADDERLKDDRPAKRAYGGSAFGSDKASTSGSLFGAPSTAPVFGSEKPKETSTVEKPIFGGFGTTPAPVESKPIFSLGGGNSQGSSIFANGSSTASFSFGQNAAPSPAPSAPSGSASFTFGSNASEIKNPFATNGSVPSISFEFGSGTSSGTGGGGSGQPSFVFGGSQPATQPTTSSSFTFDAGSTTPAMSFGGASGSSTPATQANSFTFGGTNPTNPAPSGNMFAFGGSQGLASEQQQAPNMFSGLAPGGGTSTGTNTPFTFGGASSLATTPATGTPEPGAEHDDGKGKEADGDDAPQEQISLTEGGPGEEDEVVVHEVRAKAVKLVLEKDSEESSPVGKDKKNPWKTQGVGPLRILKHKTTGAVRLLLRAEPRGNVALNKAILPNFDYKPESEGGKYVKITTANDSGKGLETWMLQVKTPALAKTLAENLETNKDANKK